MSNEGEGASAPLRLSVLIPSRGRPFSLMESVLTMHLKTSGKHTVNYVIGCDADDHGTIAMALALRECGMRVFPKIAARPPSLGGLSNALAEFAPADVYCSMADDVKVLTPDWDEVIAAAWREKPDGLWWWSCKSEALCAIVSEKWRAAAGRIYTDYFPMWYDDVWLIEVQRYALGRKGDRLDVWLDDRAPGTHRMRDLAFWDRFFWSRREERRAHARAIAEKLGWPRVDNLDGLDINPNPAFKPDDIEARQGDRAPPTPEYLAAYNRAEALQKEAA